MLTTTRPEASRTARTTYAQLAGMLPCRSLTQAYVTGALYAFDPTGRSVTFEGAGLVPGSPITITERYRDGTEQTYSVFEVLDAGTFVAGNHEMCPEGMDSLTMSATSAATGETLSATVVLKPCAWEDPAPAPTGTGDVTVWW